MLRLFNIWLGIDISINKEYFTFTLGLGIILGINFTWLKSNDWLEKEKFSYNIDTEGIWFWWNHGELYVSY